MFPEQKCKEIWQVAFVKDSGMKTLTTAKLLKIQEEPEFLGKLYSQLTPLRAADPRDGVEEKKLLHEIKKSEETKTVENRSKAGLTRLRQTDKRSKFFFKVAQQKRWSTTLFITLDDGSILKSCDSLHKCLHNYL